MHELRDILLFLTKDEKKEFINLLKNINSKINNI